jgi:hypothetical protein
MKTELIFLAAASVWFCFWITGAGWLGLFVVIWVKKGVSDSPAVWWAVIASYVLMAIAVYGWGVSRVQSQWEIFSALSTLATVLLSAVPFGITVVLAFWLFRSLHFGW